MTELKVRKRKPPTEDMIDETVEDSFPASDPPAIGHTGRPGTPRKKPPANSATENKDT